MDLGYVEQILWKISHGDWWAYSSVFQTPAFGADGSLWLYPLAYGFRYLGGPFFLFTVQAMATGLTSMGLYRISRSAGWSSWEAAYLGIIFLMYPAIIGGSQFDFHPDFIALPLIVWAYFFYRTNHKPWYYVLLMLAVLAKNVVLISIGGWGIGLMVWERRVKDGITAIILSAILFFTEMEWIIPSYFHGGTESLNSALYSYLGHGITGIMIGVFLHLPLLLHRLYNDGFYALWIFGPVLALPFVGQASAPAMLSLWLLNAISSFSNQTAVNTQYQVILAGWLFTALIEAISRFQIKQRNLWIFAVFSVTLIFEILFFMVYIKPELAKKTQPINEVVAAYRHIPLHDVVYTQNPLGVWAYKYRVMGIAVDQIPGRLVDTLPTLWSEFGPRQKIPTAIIAQRPVDPFLADIIYESLRNHYHVIYHGRTVFVIQGSSRFIVPPPISDFWGWEPNTKTWKIPLWTQIITHGNINWRTNSVEIPLQPQGTVVSALPIVVFPGKFQVTLSLDAKGQKDSVLGIFTVGETRKLIELGENHVSVTILSKIPTLIPISITTTGQHVFSVFNLIIHRVS